MFFKLCKGNFRGIYAMLFNYWNLQTSGWSIMELIHIQVCGVHIQVCSHTGAKIQLQKVHSPPGSLPKTCNSSTSYFFWTATAKISARVKYCTVFKDLVIQHKCHLKWSRLDLQRDAGSKVITICLPLSKWDLERTTHGILVQLSSFRSRVMLWLSFTTRTENLGIQITTWENVCC